VYVSIVKQNYIQY